MKQATEQDIAKYCADSGYSYERLKGIMTDKELTQLQNEVTATLNGSILFDGILYSNPFSLREAAIDND